MTSNCLQVLLAITVLGACNPKPDAVDSTILRFSSTPPDSFSSGDVYLDYNNCVTWSYIFLVDIYRRTKDFADLRKPEESSVIAACRDEVPIDGLVERSELYEMDAEFRRFAAELDAETLSRAARLIE